MYTLHSDKFHPVPFETFHEALTYACKILQPDRPTCLLPSIVRIFDTAGNLLWTRRDSYSWRPPL